MPSPRSTRDSTAAFLNRSAADPYEDDVVADGDPLETFLDHAVQSRVQPVLEAVETERREAEIHALAEQYPGLRDPEVLRRSKRS